jgi:hypothetical protein
LAGAGHAVLREHFGPDDKAPTDRTILRNAEARNHEKRARENPKSFHGKRLNTSVSDQQDGVYPKSGSIRKRTSRFAFGLWDHHAKAFMI